MDGGGGGGWWWWWVVVVVVVVWGLSFGDVQILLLKRPAAVGEIIIGAAC